MEDKKVIYENREIIDLAAKNADYEEFLGKGKLLKEEGKLYKVQYKEVKSRSRTIARMMVKAQIYCDEINIGRNRLGDTTLTCGQHKIQLKDIHKIELVKATPFRKLERKARDRRPGLGGWTQLRPGHRTFEFQN